MTYGRGRGARRQAPQAERNVGMLEGTQVLTQTGYRPVQTLEKGERVLTLMGRNALFSPIVWIGVKTRRPNGPPGNRLIRIRKNAIADDMPLRDVWLAPEQGIYIEGTFFLPRQLVNHASLLTESGGYQRLWVVKLTVHDVIVADGLPVESFLGVPGSSGFGEVEGPTISNVISHERFGLPRRIASG